MRKNFSGSYFFFFFVLFVVAFAAFVYSFIIVHQRSRKIFWVWYWTLHAEKLVCNDDLA